MDTAPCGMLASSPKAYSSANNVRQIDARPRRPPSASTDQGLEIALTTYTSRRWLDWILPPPANYLLVPISCTVDGKHAGQRLSIDLVRSSADHWLWARIPSAKYHAYGRLGLLYDLEVIFAGYTKVNVVWNPPQFPIAIPQSHPSVLRVRFYLVSLSGLFIVTSSKKWANWVSGIDEEGHGGHPPTTLAEVHLPLAAMIIVAWYIRLAKGSLWSMVVLVALLGLNSLRNAVAPIDMICLLSVFHCLREYGWR